MSYGAHRLPYQADRIAYKQARMIARKTHPQPCDCPYCLRPSRMREMMAERIAEQRARSGEAPF